MCIRDRTIEAAVIRAVEIVVERIVVRVRVRETVVVVIESERGVEAVIERISPVRVEIVLSLIHISP